MRCIVLVHRIVGLVGLALLGFSVGCVTPMTVDDTYTGSVEQSRDKNVHDAEKRASEEHEREEFERTIRSIEEQRAR